MAPTGIKFFEPRADTDPSRLRRVGLCEWPTVKDATEAVVAGNNVDIEGRYTVRLAFSENKL